jgi:hypothetical protein
MAKTTPTGAQPTLNEAVSYLIKCHTREYRRECLKFWRECFGSQFADQVEARVLAEWKRGVRAS